MVLVSNLMFNTFWDKSLFPVTDADGNDPHFNTSPPFSNRVGHENCTVVGLDITATLSGKEGRVSVESYDVLSTS